MLIWLRYDENIYPLPSAQSTPLFVLWITDYVIGGDVTDPIFIGKYSRDKDLSKDTLGETVALPVWELKISIFSYYYVIPSWVVPLIKMTNNID